MTTNLHQVCTILNTTSLPMAKFKGTLSAQPHNAIATYSSVLFKGAIKDEVTTNTCLV